MLSKIQKTIIGFSVCSACVSALPLSAQGSTTTRSPETAAGKYGRYTPFACSRIASRMRGVAMGAHRITWRDRWPDTSSKTRLADSALFAQAAQREAAEVRACLAPYPVNTVEPRDLLGLGAAWLSIEDTAQATAAFQRLLSVNASSPVELRAWIYTRIIQLYNTTGARGYLATALRYTAQLDSLGPPAAGRRTDAHNWLYNTARSLDSVPFMAEQAQLATRASKEMTGDLLREFGESAARAVSNQADVLGRRDDVPGALAVLTLGIKELSWVGGATVAEFRRHIDRLKLVGQPARPLQSMVTYVPGNPKPIATITRPTTGKVSIIYFVDYRKVDEMMDRYAGMYKTMATAGPDVEFSMENMAWGNDGHRVVIKTEEEAAEAMGLYHEYLSIPAPLIVWSNYTGTRDADGWLQAGSDPNLLGLSVDVAIVDKSGKYREVLTETTPSARVIHRIAELSK